jgi:putative peptidoglycan lipid II flippase
MRALSLYAKRFFSGTLLSRISGMIRDLVMAFSFGDHPSVAAFMVAFRFSNLFRRLLGEGPFQSAFIPYFEGLRVQDSAKATLFFRQLTLLIAALLVILIILGEGALWSSFFWLSEGNQEIAKLTSLLLPGLLFICLYGLNISLLHCHDTFFIPSFAPFVCNLIWILGALFLRSQEATIAMPTLSWLIVIGFAGQWLLTLPPTLKHTSFRWKDWFHWSIPPEVKGLAKSFAFGAIGVGAVQINAFIDAIFARSADLRGPVYLWYSIRLEQLALAIFGIACVSTIVPRLSRAIKSGDLDSAQAYFSFSFKRILAVMIPCSLALFVLGSGSVNLIYGRGHFSDLAVGQTTLCLWSYTLGLIPSTMVILFSSLFYARGDFKTPTLISVGSVLCNIALNTLFVFGLNLGAISTALATSFSAWVNFFILQKLAQKSGFVPTWNSFKTLHLTCAALCGLACSLCVEHLFFMPTTLPLLFGGNIVFARNLGDQLLPVIASSCAFLAGLWLYASLFKNRELLELFQDFSPWKRRQLDS